MKYLIISFLLTFFLLNGLTAQRISNYSADEILAQRGEVYFSFQLDENLELPSQLEALTQLISIDKLEAYTVYAYANAHEYDRFRKFAYDVQVLVPPSMLIQPKMLTDIHHRDANDWDFYPSYDAYIDMMNQYVADYPTLCELELIGTLASGRQILALHINNDLSSDNDEPEFFYTSSMHGDELAGYVMTLRLIDYMLSNYETDDRIANMVDNIDIWINPLANPDGTFAGGNGSVYGATRGNANGIDFNRNFPDPEDGPHPDGNAWQPETLLFIDFAEAHDFVMSANMHGGAEVCNYPFDTWSRLAADTDWWEFVCREYADTVHEYAPATYMDDLDNGVTNGYAWYSISGGRQDYMNYFQHIREFTLEMSEIKLPPASMLPSFWEYNHRSLLNYMEQVLYGVSGIVSNSATGAPVTAKVFVENHELDESWVFSSMPMGNYHRPIKAGSYDITYSAFGYYSKTITDVNVTDRQSLILDVQLDPYVSLTAAFSTPYTLIGKGQSIDFFDESVGGNIISWEWTFEGGVPDHSTDENPTSISYLDNGYYDVSLTVTDAGGVVKTSLIENYIKVVDHFNISNEDLYSCSALLYDAGGPANDYINSEDYLMTIYPNETLSVVKLVFEEFDLEFHDDCDADYLEVYNGVDSNAPLLGRWCGSQGPDSLIATNDLGALSILFHSNESITASGWRIHVSCDTSVGSIEKKEEKVRIFPLPATDYISIIAEQLILDLKIYDFSGKEVFQSIPQSNVMHLPLDELSKGIYFIKFQLDSGAEIHKLLLQ